MQAHGSEKLTLRCQIDELRQAMRAGHTSGQIEGFDGWWSSPIFLTGPDADDMTMRGAAAEIVNSTVGQMELTGPRCCGARRLRYDLAQLTLCATGTAGSRHQNVPEGGLPRSARGRGRPLCLFLRTGAATGETGRDGRLHQFQQIYACRLRRKAAQTLDHSHDAAACDRLRRLAVFHGDGLSVHRRHAE